MSEVKTNKVSPYTGTSLTLGDAGDTINVAGSFTVDGSPLQPTLNFPTVTGVSPATVENTASAIVVTGSNFATGATVTAIATTGAIIQANTVSWVNTTTINTNFTLPIDGTYYIRVENTNGLSGQSATPILTVSDAPVWVSPTAGSLGSAASGASYSQTFVSTGDAPIAYSLYSGTLPAGTSLASATGVLSGTLTGDDELTYNFTIRSTDNESQTADRAFSLTVTVGLANGVQFN
tara:strand:+ start:28 stop:732 length:705 start_codon:yes stop_codon:yes gene_type:complete